MPTRKHMMVRPESTLRVALSTRLFGDPNAVPAPPEPHVHVNPQRRRRIRRKVFIRDGFTCQSCGLVFTCPDEWDGSRVWHEDGRTELTVDHVVPRSQGGPFTVDNLRACCEPCNQERGDGSIQ